MTPSETSLLQKLPLDDCAWMLGRVLGFAAIENAQNSHRTKVALAFNEALILAGRLEVSLPPLPSLTQDRTKDEGAAIRYLLRPAGGAIADALAAKYGVVYRALFEAALKLQILYLIYQPNEELSLALREAIIRCCHEANLPAWLWKLLDERLKEGISREDARDEIRRAEKMIWIHLNAEAPAAPLGTPASPAPTATSSSSPTTSEPPPPSNTGDFSPKLLAWELGTSLAASALGHAQRQNVEASFQNAKTLALQIGVRLPPLPALGGDQAANDAAAIFYLLKSAGMLVADRLNEEFGPGYSALFEASLKTVLLTRLYGPGEDTTKNIHQAIKRAVGAGGLPIRLWDSFLRKVEQGVPYPEMKVSLQEMLSSVRDHLSIKLKGTITGNKPSTVLRFNKHSNAIVVQVKLGGSVTVPLLYDTGATWTVIDKSTAERLGLTPHKVARYVNCATANGVVCSPMYEISSIEVGEAKVEGPIEVALIEGIRDNMSYGLLGLNFIRAFITEVDLDQGTITFKAR